MAKFSKARELELSRSMDASILALVIVIFGALVLSGAVEKTYNNGLLLGMLGGFLSYLIAKQVMVLLVLGGWVK